jgi:NADH-quinone oxidoreductase subunit A
LVLYYLTPMPTTYAETWFPVLVQIIIAMGVAGAMIGISAVLGHRVRDSIKSMPYESGMQPVGNARERFSVKFYLVAMVFILFDIEAIFLYPWAVIYRDLNKAARFFPFFEMLLFIVLVLCGFFYIWKKGVLNWAADRPNIDKPTQEGVDQETKRAA